MGTQDVGDLEVIRQNLEYWLAKQLGEDDSFSVGKLKFPEASGESSVTLLFDTQGKQGTQKFVLRMVPNNSEVFESHDLKLQYDVMGIVGQHGVPVPGLVAYEPNAELLGSDFYVMNFCDGLIPPDNPPMAFGSWVSELSEQQRAQMWRNGLEVLANIHQISIDHLALANLPQSAADESPVAHEMRKYQRLLELGVRQAADPLVHDVWKLLQDTVPLDGPRRLCWGDSRPGNIIYQNLKPVAIVDWELASISDPLTDLAWYFWIDHTNSVGLGTEKMSGVPEYQDAYQLWSRLTGLPIDNIAWYELFVMWRFAVIMEKKMMAMSDTDPNFLDFPNHAANLLAPLADNIR